MVDQTEERSPPTKRSMLDEGEEDVDMDNPDKPDEVITDEQLMEMMRQNWEHSLQEQPNSHPPHSQDNDTEIHVPEAEDEAMEEEQAAATSLDGQTTGVEATQEAQATVSSLDKETTEAADDGDREQDDSTDRSTGDGDGEQEDHAEENMQEPSSYSHGGSDIRYTPRRLLVTVTIGMPKDSMERAELLTEQLNSFLALARKCSTRHLRVIKYSEDKPIWGKDRKSWLKRFKGLGSDHLMTYTHGYYAWQPIRDGAFRFKLYLAIPLKNQDIATYIRVLNDAWGDNQRATVIDVQGQELHSPKKMGWLFRSHRWMANTRDLQQEMMRVARRTHGNLKFGLTNQTIPDPNGGKWDPKTSVKAIVVETNEEGYDEAWNFLTRTYNGNNPNPPHGIFMRFVGMKDHHEFRGNPSAIHNISILMKRQAVFTSDMVTASTNKIVAVDTAVRGTQTLREIVMALRPTCSGQELREGRLFHSISRNINRSGNQEFHFTYSKAVQKEAASIVSSICEFLRDEIKIDPEVCCYGHFVRDDHKWDPLTRTSTNPDTEALDFLVEDSKDLITAAEKEGGEVLMDEDEEMDEVDSKVERERQRCLGLNDEETVQSISKARRKRVPIRVQKDSESLGSGISAITDITSASRASRERKNMRSQLQAQQDRMEAQSKQIDKLMQLLTKTSVSYNEDSDKAEEQSRQDSGETSDSQDKNGEEAQEVEIDDDEQSRGVRFNLNEKDTPESSSDSESDSSSREDQASSKDSDSDDQSSNSSDEEDNSTSRLEEENVGKTRSTPGTLTAGMLDLGKKQKQLSMIKKKATGGPGPGFDV